MANPKPPDTDLRASDLKLLESGNFSDVTVICGNKTWKLHKNILCSRSRWFEKALTGGFQEAIDGVVNIQEHEPEAVDVLLKYIYGGVTAVDMVKETSNRLVAKFCVDLHRAADFFLLQPLLPIIRSRLGDYCDEKMKWLCTRGNVLSARKDSALLSWTKDVAKGISEAHKWKIEPVKKILMEFVWVGRTELLDARSCIRLQDHLDDVPNFLEDLLNRFAIHKWTKNAVWIPKPVHAHRWGGACARCGKKLVQYSKDSVGANGQIMDTFNTSFENGILREWCKDCAALDMIPWRETES